MCVRCSGLTGCKETPDPVPNFREYAYISNGGSNNVTVVDLRGLRVQAIVPVGKSPTGLATNPQARTKSTLPIPNQTT